MKVFLRKVNLVRPLCNKLIGKDHEFHHRAVGGIAIMIVGVLVAKYTGHTGIESINVIGETVGFSLHDIGLSPFLESLLEEEV